MGQLGRFCHQMEVPEEGEGRSGPARKPSKAITVVTPEKKSHRLVLAARLSLAMLKDERKKKTTCSMEKGVWEVPATLHGTYQLCPPTPGILLTCSAARINTASKFCFEARQAEETSTWEVCFVWVNGDVAPKKQCPFSAERAQPFLPSQGRQPSTDAAVELVCSKCWLDFFGVCIIQVIQVISTFNIWQNSYKVKPTSCKLEFVTCTCSNDSGC